MTRASSTRAKRSVESKPRKRKPRALRSFEQANRYLLDRPNFELIRQNRIEADSFKLDRIQALLEELDHPQRSFRSVHVAGSKGKGSVCEMLASALGSCGYAVGVYTSPHLVDIHERIRVNDRALTDDEFVAMTNRVRVSAAQIAREWGEPTFFELMTAMAFTYFMYQAVDIAVIEVGLGGRLDCTNVITPEISAIASIQLEHTDILGKTIEEIAAEKAGIIKPGIPVITVPQEEAVIETLRARAQSLDAPLYVLGEEIDYSCRFEADRELGPHARICVSTSDHGYEHMAVPLKGEHQAANCALALGVLNILAQNGFIVPECEVSRGLAQTPASGRLELAWNRPRVILDTAHTPESVRCLVNAIGAHMRFDSLVAIFGCSADKAVDGMLDEIARGADKIVFTQASDHPRAMNPSDLAVRFRERSGKMCQIEPDVKSAINCASRAVDKDDLIVITGSCFVVGEAKKLLREHARKARSAGR